jgi:glycosyltransferase involved in cell wall biosynthesis
MANSGRKSLVVLLPAFNEEATVGEVVRSVLALTPVLREQGFEARVWVVDDGSTDATAERALQAGAARILRHRVNRGLGAAVRTGLAAARAEGVAVVVKCDADFQHDPADIPALLAPLVEDQADIVYGDRFSRISYRMPWVRRAGNWAFSRLMHLLTGWPIRDGQPGILAIGEAYLGVFSLPGDYNYTQQILLDAYHKGMRFEHVAVAFRPRQSGQSFVSLRYPFKVITQILMVLAGVKPMLVFAPVGFGFMGFAGITFVVELAWFLAGFADKPVRHVNLVMGTGLFGLQALFFGILAELIVQSRRS